MIRNLFKKINKNKISYLLMLPFMIPFFTFTVLPAIRSIYYSFTYYNILEKPVFIGADNYIRLFLKDDIFMTALKNTFLIAVVTGPLGYLMCFVLAWLINEMKTGLRSFLTLIFYAPSISGGVFIVWTYIFNDDRYGFINNLLIRIGVISRPIEWLHDSRYIIFVVIVVQLWLSLGTGFLAFVAGLKTIDKSMSEAAAVDGIKNRYQELWFITLPAMKQFLMFGAVMQITQSFAVGDITTILFGFPSVDYAGHTIINHLTDYGILRFDLGYASAIASVLFFIMIFSNKIIQKILSKVGN